MYQADSMLTYSILIIQHLSQTSNKQKQPPSHHSRHYNHHTIDNKTHRRRQACKTYVGYNQNVEDNMKIFRVVPSLKEMAHTACLLEEAV